ncbi:hypothetical protein A2678_00270 [Candidatus Kaiserbacteria bacterium RIFCSPHIGHO2_01_FULL_53_31]|uniref:Prepilin peptidase A24 N-terminal domain-containing protein n=1 Tax=Candidatus Kaiserbacteria bacterium RIFCSPHIGHO2_01_FULL_53_31 TaxID=1798481 RepID=A0A1F6CH40_9BACT|nr:MAG: hypothetical protein A2678_00270 [Candidatus Kaiserbacteria bacterium RIFCSPHIGHO2_01_FULL_53_31]
MISPLAAMFFALGAIIASFAGVVVARLNTGHSFVSGRSLCDACGEPIAPLALVPIISFFAAGGRARCCDTRLSLYAPLTELLLGGLFTLAYIRLGLVPALGTLCITLALLLALVLYDAKHQVLPPVLLWLFVASAALTGFLTATTMGGFGASMLVALLIAFFFVAIHVLSRGRAMGLSDAPLAFGLALLTGPEFSFAGLAFSFWIGAVVGIIILAGRPRGSRMGVEVPFAPYLAAGFLLAYIIQWNPFALIMAQ